MNNQSLPPPIVSAFSEADIRAYAFHLYQEDSCTPGQDLANWLEATACLRANIPPHQSGTRLHQHLHRPAGDFSLLSIEARILAS